MRQKTPPAALLPAVNATVKRQEQVTNHTSNASFVDDLQLPMSDYRIEKSRCPVVVTTHSGETITGEMFLQPFGRHDGGMERPQDILNGDEPFFPLALSENETVLIAKEQVVEVSLAFDPHDAVEYEMLARPTVIEVRLVNGATHAGAIFLQLPLERPRLLDFLNRDVQRFLTLHGTERRLLINRRVIERVRPLD
jgi:hypothetical protein